MYVASPLRKTLLIVSVRFISVSKAIFLNALSISRSRKYDRCTRSLFLLPTTAFTGPSAADTGVTFENQLFQKTKRGRAALPDGPLPGLPQRPMVCLTEAAVASTAFVTVCMALPAVVRLPFGVRSAISAATPATMPRTIPLIKPFILTPPLVLH